MLTGGKTDPTPADQRKVDLIVWMRKMHQDTLERSSTAMYRQRRVRKSPAPRLLSASRKYRGMRWLPAPLLAVEKLPSESLLPTRYVANYYGLGKAIWSLYGLKPIDPELAWSEDSSWNNVFPKGDSRWGDPSSERTFVQLRLQGPNPFMLKAVDDDGNFELNFCNLFEGVFDSTIARFTIDETSDLGLRATSISIGERIFRPGDEDPQGWENAKRVVNALDVRAAVFIRHLLNTHLMVGQAFAAAAYTLPEWHPLRPFMDFFTYGTLQVNHFAYDALLKKSSYFIRSGFVTPADARHLIKNAMSEFDFDEWIAPLDIAKRGIDQIPNHPYVADAQTIWPAIELVVERHLNDIEIFDDDLVEDPCLVAWYATMRQIIPDAGLAKTLTCRQDLETLMTGLIYNNVIHEICGNMAPILDSRDPVDKLGVNLDHLRSLIDDERLTETPRAAEVLLMDQASYVSSFNVAGNNLMTVNAARYIDDPRLRMAVEELQATLVALDETLTERNAAREIPFAGMQPRVWEASISF